MQKKKIAALAMAGLMSMSLNAGPVFAATSKTVKAPAKKTAVKTTKKTTKKSVKTTAKKPKAETESVSSSVCTSTAQVKSAALNAVLAGKTSSSLWISEGVSPAFSSSTAKMLISMDDGLKTNGDYAYANLANVKYEKDSSFGRLNAYNYSFTYYLTSAQNTAYVSKVNAILKNLALTKDSDAVKAKKIYNYLGKHVTYASYSKTTRTGYSALVNKRAVSYGYAQAMYTLCRHAGIPARIIIGSINGVYGAWNIVKTDGKWYICDASRATKTDDSTWFMIGSSSKIKPDPVYTTKSFKKSFPVSTKAHAKVTITSKPTSSKGKTKKPGKKTEPVSAISMR